MQLSVQGCKLITNSRNETFKSLYKDEIANAQDIKEAIRVLSSAYPIEDKIQSACFFALLGKRIEANNFTKKRKRI